MSIRDSINKSATLTIDSIETIIKVYKEENSRTDDYGVGYDDAMDTVLRNLKMYRKIIADQHAKETLSE